MKNILTLSILLLAFISASSQTSTFSLIGKWQEIEYSENVYGKNGLTPVIQSIKNGRVFVFGKNNIVKDGLGNKGTYYLKADCLHIKLAKVNFYYYIHYDTNNKKRLNFSPVDEKCRFECDEGCSYIFKKI